MGFPRWITRTTAVLVTSLCLGSALEAEDIIVFAAASLKEALDRVAATYSQTEGVSVVTSYAGSSALARQIQLGAPADIFISANTAWMDQLESSGAILAETRFDLLGNRLVLIAQASTTSPVEITANLDLKAMLGNGRMAMALTEAVPAGIYGKAALTTLGVWDQVAASVAQTDNVRAALALVAIGAARLGIVYATDAQADTRVMVAGVFGANTHPPIRYPAAVVVGGQEPVAQAFLDYLRSKEAQDIFERFGFVSLGK